MLELFNYSVLNQTTNKKEVVDLGVTKVFADQVWNVTKGKNVKVAVLDSGVDTKHSDIKIEKSIDFTKSKSGVMDIKGHGTHVAGIIGAVDNEEGVIGIAPECLLYNCKILDDRNRGSFEWLVNALEWCIENKIDIINMSLGTHSEPPESVKKAVKKAYDNGIIMVAASGNENKTICWPARYDEVIAVSAIDSRNNKANFSNYGVSNEFVALGVNVYSTYINNSYAKLSGTSMATPIVTGCIALYVSALKSKNKKKKMEEIYKDLVDSSTDIGQKGKDIYYGYGMIDCRKLINKA